MKVHVDPEDVVKRTTDDRGRIYLGKEHANKVIEVAILESGEE